MQYLKMNLNYLRISVLKSPQHVNHDTEISYEIWRSVYNMSPYKYHIPNYKESSTESILYSHLVLIFSLLSFLKERRQLTISSWCQRGREWMCVCAPVHCPIKILNTWPVFIKLGINVMPLETISLSHSRHANLWGEETLTI